MFMRASETPRTVTSPRPVPSPWMPPTSWRCVVTPGSSAATRCGARLDGSASSSSSSKTVWRSVLCTSTLGVSPVTVIVSSSAPTTSSALTEATKEPGELDAFAPDGGEARQREGDDVIAGPEVLDPVLPAAVRHDRPDLLNQRGARRFDRHAWQHCSRCVSNHAGDRRLGIGRRGEDQKRSDERQRQRDTSVHGHLRKRGFPPWWRPYIGTAG